MNPQRGLGSLLLGGKVRIESCAALLVADSELAVVLV
jgi:hypothetical protein